MPFISKMGGGDTLIECLRKLNESRTKIAKLEKQNAKLKEQLSQYEEYSELIRFLEEKDLSPDEAMMIIQTSLAEKALEYDENFDELEPDIERILRWA